MTSIASAPSIHATISGAEEARNPQRGLPIGILGSLLICTIPYLLFSRVITGLAVYLFYSRKRSKLREETWAGASPRGGWRPPSHEFEIVSMR